MAIKFKKQKISIIHQIERAGLDEKGKEIGRGLVGSPEIKLNEGGYILRLSLFPRGVRYFRQA